MGQTKHSAATNAPKAPRRRACRRAALVLVVLMVLAGCVPYRRLDQPGVNQWEPPARRVLIGGDSITVAAQADLLQELTDETTWWTNVKAGNGWLASDFQANDDAVLNHVGFEPDAAVINIGTNDTEACDATPGCAATWQALELDDVWSPYRDSAVPCRIGVTTVYEPNGITAVNTRLGHLLATATLTAIADWKTHSNAHPEWFVDAQGHLSVDGRDAYADFIVGELEQACPAAP